MLFLLHIRPFIKIPRARYHLLFWNAAYLLYIQCILEEALSTHGVLKRNDCFWVNNNPLYIFIILSNSPFFKLKCNNPLSVKIYSWIDNKNKWSCQIVMCTAANETFGLDIGWVITASGYYNWLALVACVCRNSGPLAYNSRWQTCNYYHV